MTNPESVPPSSKKTAPAGDLGALIATAQRAADWSATADKLKNGVVRARQIVFALSILGATAATIAGQMPSTGSLRTIFATFGAVALAIAAFVSGRSLRAAQIAPWVRVRAAAEALKREAFRFAASAAPYSDVATASDLLNGERTKIDADLGDIVQITATRKGSSPREPLTPDEYRKLRVRSQIDEFFLPKANDAYRQAQRLRRFEFGLALLAVIITAVSSVTGKTTFPFTTITFDLAAFTALLTTIAATVLAHIEGSRLEYLASSYAATARRLEDEDSRFSRAVANDWSGFVNHCEDIIASENQSWMAKWTRATDSRPAASANQ
ncbi:DUF4231 domain-containing protein [Methylocella tundrae]|uniref:DUF4231 domain-containing protein n=1 Tax=Methylocella tundrae TaxID=227605 RepID=UPI0030FDF8C2|nr:DUF4231 domain-containing protein [Methylocella tundrae]